MPVIVKGIPEAQSRLGNVSTELQDLSSAHSQVAQVVVNAARAPRDTGRLQASIRQFPSSQGVRVGSDVPYAIFMEARYGFLRVAVKSTEGQLVAIYRQAVTNICEGL